MCKKPIIIYGASGHSKVVADIVNLEKNYSVFGYIDDFDKANHGAEFFGSRIVGGRNDLLRLRKEKNLESVIIAFGDNKKRLDLLKYLKKEGFNIVRACHPKSIVADDVQIGCGSVIAAGAIVNSASFVGQGVIINTGATVDHDCFINDGAHISPGCHLAGNVSVGKCTWVGIGSVVKENIMIGDNCIIGAGSVVLENIPNNTLAYGSPAINIKSLK